MATRIGPRMTEAALYVALHPGTCIRPVASHVGPHGSLRYGYAIVHRAIRAGIIVAGDGPRGTYALFAKGVR